MKNFFKWLATMLALIMLVITIFAMVVDASEPDWQLSANLYKTVASDVESIVQSGAGLQISLSRNSLFLYLSKDVHQVRFAGQGGRRPLGRLVERTKASLPA